jgi:arginyl-tRNA--protein-N-Asp/Glu arginylyltransferase
MLEPKTREEVEAKNAQNVYIAEACAYIREEKHLKPYKDYTEAGMKLLGYHVRKPVLQPCCRCCAL